MVFAYQPQVLGLYNDNHFQSSLTSLKNQLVLVYVRLFGP